MLQKANMTHLSEIRTMKYIMSTGNHVTETVPLSYTLPSQSVPDPLDSDALDICPTHIRDCDFINGRNALAVYYMKITINELLNFTE